MVVVSTPMTPKRFHNMTYRRLGHKIKEGEFKINQETNFTVHVEEIITASKEVNMTESKKEEATF